MVVSGSCVERLSPAKAACLSSSVGNTDRRRACHDAPGRRRLRLLFRLGRRSRSSALNFPAREPIMPSARGVNRRPLGRLRALRGPCATHPIRRFRGGGRQPRSLKQRVDKASRLTLLAGRGGAQLRRSQPAFWFCRRAGRGRRVLDLHAALRRRIDRSAKGRAREDERRGGDGAQRLGYVSISSRLHVNHPVGGASFHLVICVLARGAHAA
jgi:hypothetical protein